MEADRDAKRSVELRVTNAVFSKLIKIGREKGQTPQRTAQALFDEAYEAECLGKKSAPAAGDVWKAKHDDVQKAYDAVSLLLRDERRKHAQARLAIEELEAAAKLAAGVTADLQAELDRARLVIADKDRMLLDKAAEIREAAKSPLVVANQALDALKAQESPAEIYRRIFPDRKPVEIPPPSDRPTEPQLPLRTIKAMAAAGNRPATIARELGLDLDQVKAALA